MIADEAGARAWLEALPEWDADASRRIERLVVLLSAENRRQNLVSSSSLAQIWARHIADSAQLLAHVSRETAGPWLDMGTGAGFPGLVVAALRPDLPITLAEARPKRAAWLEHARLELKLSETTVAGSVERLDGGLYRVISARAFAPLDKLLALSARFSTADTLWLLPKGRSAQQELSELRGWEHMFHVEQSVTDTEAGIIVGHLGGKKGGKA